MSFGRTIYAGSSYLVVREQDSWVATVDRYRDLPRVDIRARTEEEVRKLARERIRDRRKQYDPNWQPPEAVPIDRETWNFSNRDLYLLWAAMQAMVNDEHAPQDQLDGKDWQQAGKLLKVLDDFLNQNRS